MKDKLFKDKNGRVVLWQSPNIALLSGVVATGLGWLVRGGLAHYLSWIAFGSIVVWAILELTTGVNYFRRLLGLAVLVISIIGRIK